VNSNARILDFSSKNILFLSFENSIYGYDFTNNKTKNYFQCDSSIYGISVNHYSDNFIGLALKSGKCEIADLKSKISVRSFEALSGSDKVVTMEWTPQLLVNGTNQGHVIYRDVRSKLSEALVFNDHNTRITCIKSNAFNSSLIISADDDGMICLTDKRKGLVRVMREHYKSVRSLAWSNSNSSMFASAGKYDGKIVQWNIMRAESSSALETESRIYNVDYTAESNIIASCGEPDNDVRIYDADGMQRIVQFQSHLTPVYHMVLNRDRNMAVTCSQEGRIKFWDLKNQMRGEERKEQMYSFEQMR
jgi:WD40 repeat protein